MKSNTNPERNKPAEDGRRNDPALRDESALQPGISTISSSDTDDANQHLTRTASDDFRTTDTDKNADQRFDEVENDVDE